MRTQRGAKFLVVGLGALALTACAGKQRQPVEPQPEPVAVDKAQLGASIQQTTQQLSQCNALRAKVSVQEEYALGAAVAANWVKSGGGLMLSDDAEKELELYLNRVGGNLAAQSARPTLQWTFGALQEPKAINATSAPGGYVFLTRGLLAAVENEAQLAGVMAHEVAHVTLRHALTRYDDVKVHQCRVSVALRAATKQMQQTAPLHAGKSSAFAEAVHSGALDLDKHHDVLAALTDKLVEKIITEGYADRDEYAADEEAVRLLLSAGYDPQEYVAFLGKLPEVQESFAHHPSKVNRQKQVRLILSSARKDSGEFPELPAGTSGLKKPALPAVFSLIKAKAGTP
jgi:predicted Zn-dependent protease